MPTLSKRRRKGDGERDFGPAPSSRESRRQGADQLTRWAQRRRAKIQRWPSEAAAASGAKIFTLHSGPTPLTQALPALRGEELARR